MATTIDPNDRAPREAARRLLVQQLNEAHAIEKALVTTLQAHITMTPPGPYLEILERHLSETRRHAAALERRLAEHSAGAGLFSATVGLVQAVLGQALALSKGPVDMLRGSGGAEKLLKNARDECASEALEIAAYDALATLAEAAGDEQTARLAADHRAQEERMLSDLRRVIPSLADATVLERSGGGATEREAPASAAGATVRPLLPIADYDALDAGEVVSRLTELTQRELRVVAEHERRSRARRSVLERVEALQGDEPWTGYDEAPEAVVLERLRGAAADTVTRVRDYESRHRRRVAVLEAAQRELSRS